jgi:Holliday junction resolvase RusA-like endonuclease
LTITVRADPKGQGNHRTSHAGAIYETTKGHKGWRDTVTLAAREAMSASYGDAQTLFSAPVAVKIAFTLAKPKSVKRALPSCKPDLDKLVRSTLDALTKAGVWTDDGLVCRLEASKVYPNGLGGLGEPGAIIIVSAL